MKTKMFNTRPRSSWVLLLSCCFLAAGCSLPQVQPDLSRYFVLTGSSVPSTRPAATANAANQVRIGLRAVDVPVFLRNKAMLVRLSRNEVRFIEEARWAEPLDAGIARVLRENLDSHPGVSGVALVSAMSDQARDFDVMVRVLRCEGGRDGDVARFAARIEILSPNANHESRATDVFSTEITGWNGSDYGQLARKLSEAIGAMADRIVTLAATTKPRD